jgi:hypothetical protein
MQMGLDLTSAGTLLEVANFTISNNTTSWDLAFTFSNGTIFKKGAGGSVYTEVPWTNLTMNPIGGTLGTGVTTLNPATAITSGVTPYTATIGQGMWTEVATDVAASKVVTWDPETQTSPTISYQISMRASWAAGSSMMAGLYTETITAVLTATL